ncbi:MAG: sodium-dependent transporter [Methylococcaceae bacterium]
MPAIKTSIHGEWSSKFAFILAATGSAVGLGNIWKFPYIAGENGGGAFVLLYLACVFAMGIPIMIAETMLGRRGRQSPINTMQTLAEEAGVNKNWRYIGWIGVMAGFLILSYYSVIAGWSIAYVFKVLTGTFSGVSPNEVGAMFDEFVGQTWVVTFWHTVFMVVTMYVVARGVQGGLEKAVRFLMPGLFVILLIMVGYAMTTGFYFQGIKFLFSPDFSKITGHSVLIAVGQAFFTLSLGMGAIMIYGSYLPKNISIAKSTFIIAAADTIVALLAGVAIFPIVFANGLEPGSGPSLIFKSLPIAFGQMPLGSIFGCLFFVLLVFAALSSSISLIEPAVAWVVENQGKSRKNACIITGFITWLVGLGTVFSFNVWSEIKLFDRTFFDLLDFVTANLMLPIGGFFIAIFAGWMMRQRHAAEELDMSEESVQFKLWQFLVKYVAPASVFLVFLNVIGIL